MAKIKKHHYIPRFYLKGFTLTKKSSLIVFDKKDNSFYQSSISNIAMENNYYSFLQPNGEKDQESFEKFFNTIETKASEIIISVKKQKKLTEEEIDWFSIFIALFRLRVPKWRRFTEEVILRIFEKFAREMVIDPERLKSIVDRFEENSGEIFDIPLDKLREMILDNKIKISINNHVISLLLMSKMLFTFASILAQMNWAFLETHSSFSLVTCDNPIFYNDPFRDNQSIYGLGLTTKTIELTLPVTKNIALLMTWDNNKQGYYKINQETAKSINHRTIASADRFIYAGTMTNELKKIINKYNKITPDNQIGENGPYIIAANKPYILPKENRTIFQGNQLFHSSNSI